MKVSVALATYNGARYLREQIESIIRQTFVPDEIVVCDDGSTDETLQILQEYRDTTKGIQFRICKNDANLGYAKNFSKAIELCVGDVIFLCDQDDVWFDDKLAIVTELFIQRSDIVLAVNDADLVDEELRPLGFTIHQQLKGLGMRPEHNLYGCCMAFRREMVPVIMPVPTELMGHDGWINVIANALCAACRFDRSLQLYRRHGANASSGAETDTRGASRWRLLFSKILARKVCSPVQASMARIAQLDALRSRLNRDQTLIARLIGDSSRVNSAIEKASQLLSLNRARLEIQKRSLLGRCFGAARMLLTGGYRDFEGLKSCVRDILG